MNPSGVSHYSFHAWVAAIRPKTLPAGILPVIVGSACAYHEGHFSTVPALLALVCAVLIQIITNFVNEVYDFRKGADTDERLGPMRTVASGIIPEAIMVRAAIVVAIITFTLGLWLVILSGPIIFIIGIVSLIMAWAYTGGPYPLAYKGLGEIFVILFFGLAAVMGTYYVQAGQWSSDTFVLGIALGLLSANLLSINNIRDIDTDQKAQKRTVATRIGRKNAEKVIMAQTFVPFIIPVYLFTEVSSFAILLPLCTLPYAVKMLRSMNKRQGAALNQSLQDSAKVLVIYGILLAVGLILA